MNQEQESYISLINRTSRETIRIKKTGWEEVNLPGHTHDQCQIVYTLSGTLHVQIGSTNYFVPEKHIAWIPGCTEHKLCSNNRQTSLVIFYLSLDSHGGDEALKDFSIYHTDSFVAENLKFIASKGTEINRADTPDLYAFALGFFRLLPSISQNMGFLLKTLTIPNDARLHPILAYLQEHLQENLKMPQLAEHFGFSVRNLSRLFNESGIRFSYYVNNLRIMRAIELFADGGKTMQQIAYEVGFTTPNNFNRVFRQITGMSPNAFMKND
ncbi:AraC family transcriptional regulator [uncultured Bacteroides sp.]|uniref:AraC family transcriptional regulator n=1 Tax=uncultured Bacteroides sp. TaxID=162156 RepID=UPI0015AC0457|nr:AraC family transcriptional regulator [uncultured Bacteroides sp.]